MNVPTQLIIVEDHEGIRESLKFYFERDKSMFHSVSTFESVEDLLQSEQDFSASIFLLDVNLPGMTGIEGIFHIKNKWSNIEILIFSVLTDSENIFNAICAGASGYLEKDAPLSKVKESIQQIIDGGSAITPLIARKVFDHFKKPESPKSDNLTEREHDVVEGIIDGLSYKLIAYRLDVSINTVRKYIRSIYRKLEINSKGELITRYHSTGI